MPDQATSRAPRAARPTITIDGQTQPALSERLRSLLVEETTAGLFRTEATFANFDQKTGGVGYLYFDRSLLEFGKQLQIKLGSGATEGTVFDGRIMALEGRFPHVDAPEILLLAEDRLQDLRMTRRTRTFEDVSDAELFRQIAVQHSLQADVDLTGPTHKVLAQVNQSDLAFLRDRARAVDAELWVDGRTLHAASRSRRRTNDVSLTYLQGLFEFSALADLAGQVSGFTIAGWDVAAKQALNVRATDSAVSGELGRDAGGSRILQQAVGRRDQQIVHSLPVTSDEAQSLADAHYRRVARRFVTGTGVADGDGRIRVGTRLDLQGLGPLFSGAFYVTAVRHLFDTDGYRTWFEVERPGIGQ